MRLLFAVFAVTACGDNDLAYPQVGPSIELPLLASADPATPYNHSCETTVAAHAGRVVVASIQLHLASEMTYTAGDSFRKRVAINVSSDDGQSFSEAIDPGLGDGTDLGDQTTDPVVRAAADGSFFLTAIRANEVGMLARSVDLVSWSPLVSADYHDKEWLAVDDVTHEVYVGATGGFWRYDFDGNIKAAVSSMGADVYQMVGAYADSDGAHFASAGTPSVAVPTILLWDGTESPALVTGTLDAGADVEQYTTVAWSRGPLGTGSWAVYGRRVGTHASLIVRVENAVDAVEIPLTDPEAVAFLPAAALDSGGHLHVVWYDSSGPVGVLRYTHSRGPAPFDDGFIDPIVIDASATAGDGWYPEENTDHGGRRLREYIGIATDNELVHIAWTHSPSPPSRVYTVTVRPFSP